MHGRNAAQGWQHANRDDRYDYLYSSDELQEFVETARATGELVKKTYVYANNHFSAKSIANAAMIRKQLGQPLPGEYSEAFVTRYPDLRGALKISAARTLV